MSKTAFPIQQLDLSEDGGEAILIRHSTRKAWRVNPVGRFLSEQLQSPVEIRALERSVLQHFDVGVEECSRAVDDFLEQLIGLEAVEILEDSSPMRRRYLDLLKRALVNLIYPEHELRIEWIEREGAKPNAREYERRVRDIRYLQADVLAALVAHKTNGTNWHRRVTRFSHTMIGLRRLDNLEYCAAKIFADGVPGDFLEAGVCQGGASIFLRALQVAYDQPERVTWVADSFRGLPPPETDVDREQGLHWTEDRFPWLACSVQAVKDNFRTYDLLSDNVRFLEGWFSETLPHAPVGQLALLRLDGDLYSSTRDILVSLYDKVSPGGFIVVDDYGAIDACKLAVEDFRRERGIETPLRYIDWTGVYWRKES